MRKMYSLSCRKLAPVLILFFFCNLSCHCESFSDTFCETLKNETRYRQAFAPEHLSFNYECAPENLSSNAFSLPTQFSMCEYLRNTSVVFGEENVEIEGDTRVNFVGRCFNAITIKVWNGDNACVECFFKEEIRIYPPRKPRRVSRLTATPEGKADELGRIVVEMKPAGSPFFLDLSLENDDPSSRASALEIVNGGFKTVTGPDQQVDREELPSFARLKERIADGRSTKTTLMIVPEELPEDFQYLEWKVRPIDGIYEYHRTTFKIVPHTNNINLDWGLANVSHNSKLVACLMIIVFLWIIR